VSSLATVDIPGVEIAAVGPTTRGDRFTIGDLRALADADAELGDEIKPPLKLGHATGEPAVGWVENVRLNAAETKLVADLKRVPRRLRDFLDVGAWRTRSPEIGAVTSQRSGRRFDKVVRGVALLGAELPAIQTLDDLVRLYQADDAVSTDVVADVDTAIREGRISPQERDYFEGIRNAEFRRAAIALRPQTVFGPGVEMSLEDQHSHHLAAQLGVKVEELI
jgi:hypothetical protein